MIKYNIQSGFGYPSSELSNYAHHSFIFDGIQVSGMEGLLQSFKFPDPHEQIHVCTLSGRIAWKYGQKSQWYNNQVLFWQGRSFCRHGNDYQLLLDDAYQSLCSNPNFVKALLDTHDNILVHTIGSMSPSQTILTEKEFCDRLSYLRTIHQYGLI